MATQYDMIHPNASATATVCSLFIIGPDKLVKLIITYPASTGRNFHEVLRLIDSLQLTVKHMVATPANWQYGEDIIVGTSPICRRHYKKFPKGVNFVKPSLRSSGGSCASLLKESHQLIKSTNWLLYTKSSFR